MNTGALHEAPPTGRRAYQAEATPTAPVGRREYLRSGVGRTGVGELIERVIGGLGFVHPGAAGAGVKGAGGGAAIPDSVVSRTDDNNTASVSSIRGIEIQPNDDFGEIGARISNNTSNATTAYALKSSDFSVMESVDISTLSAGDAFSIGANFQSGTNYIIGVDAGGSSFTVGFVSDSGVVNGTDIDILGGYNGTNVDETYQGTNDIGNPDNVLG